MVCNKTIVLFKYLIAKMFGIYEVCERGSMKNPKEIEQPYKHMDNSKQLNN